MKKFYLHNGTEQEGPFSIEELKEKNVKRDTNVWAEGMDQWDKAGNLEVLNELFISVPPTFITPPPIGKVKEKHEISSKPKKRRSLSWVIIIISLTTLGIIYLSKDNGEQGIAALTGVAIEIPREKTPEELRQELLQKEQMAPSEYLVHNGGWRTNILGVMVLEGTIFNAATMAGFKDVVLEVTWLSKTQTEIATNQYRIFEYVAAGNKVPYKLKVDAPRETQGVNVKVVSATPVGN